jgi:hypothetical protein
VTPNYLVKRKVRFATKKNEIATPESAKVTIHRPVCEDHSPNFVQYGTSIAKAATGLRACLHRIFIRKLEVRGRWMADIPRRVMDKIGEDAEVVCCIKEAWPKN